MADEPDRSQNWVEAGLRALAEGGIDRVRVEVLAQSLGVTKGGFYRRFKDRPALQEAMLETWTEGRMAAIRQQTELGGASPRDRLQAIVRLFAERRNAHALSIELAIRQWARADARAAAAVAKVDAIRLASVSGLYQMLGFSPAEAQARGLVFYAFIFGQGLLFPDATPAERDVLMAASADALVDVGED